MSIGSSGLRAVAGPFRALSSGLRVLGLPRRSAGGTRTARNPEVRVRNAAGALAHLHRLAAELADHLPKSDAGGGLGLVDGAGQGRVVLLDEHLAALVLLALHLGHGLAAR